MSHSYEMQITISNYDAANKEKIFYAAQQEWTFSTLDTTEENIFGSGQGTLVQGETEDDFVKRTSLAVWKANGKYCNVHVTAIYLDDPPTDEYELDEEEYKNLIKE